jgi:hypothetical protein
MWSEVVSIPVTPRSTLIFAGVGQRAVVLTNPGPTPVRLHSGSVGVNIEAGHTGALTALSDIYVQTADNSEPLTCRVQFAVSGT